MSELQFPKNPAVGQEYDFPPYKYYWDGVKWKTKGIGYNPVNDLRDELEPRISDNESKVFEALRRSYADAGFNLVEGSFEEGGTLSSVSDVLLQDRTGKAFSGPMGIVAAGTNPADGGFVDVSYAQDMAEEWVNCATASYLSPSTFKLTGNFTDSYTKGRKVRLDSNDTDYDYSTVVNSVYAAGETTVTVSNNIVKTGLIHVCSSIVGPNSSINSVDIGGVTNYQASSIDDMINGITLNKNAITIALNQQWSSGGTSWKCIDEAAGITLDNFRAFNVVNVFDCGVVADYKGVSGQGTDNTAAINKAVATGLPLFFPPGDIRITGQIGDYDKRNIPWYGSGKFQSRIYCDGTLTANETTDDRGKMKITGIPYVIAPVVMEHLGFFGINEKGIGLQVGKDGSFIGSMNWTEIEINNFGLGVNLFNLYISSWNSVQVKYCKRGVQIKPTDSPGSDDGYFTTFQWSDCLIGYNKGFGLSVYTPLGTRNFSMENTVIEGNCTDLDKSEGQFCIANAKVHMENCYMEATPDVPAIYAYAPATIEMTDPYFNNTGGLKWDSALTLSVEGGSFVGTGDKTWDGPLNLNQNFYLKRTSLPKDHRVFSEAGGQIVNAIDNGPTRGFYSNQGLQLRGGTSQQCSTITRTRTFKKTLGSVTVPANGRSGLITDYLDSGSIGDRTTAMCKLYGIAGNSGLFDIQLQYCAASTTSNSYFSVIAFNNTGSPINLSGATLLVTQIMTDPNTMIDIT